ncbi:unnamed protein product [Blumeria hordei]|uniref:CFEM domain-containing protein n=1 Tax=Blumeria hordei TaxID=2867405 RepID=A0A383V2E5_BLUHO|nr:unnamed protein product [Blumeria hordei]
MYYSLLLRFYYISLFLAFSKQVNSYPSSEGIRDLPLCAKQCAAQIHAAMSGCPLANKNCACKFLDSYTFCAISHCQGLDLAPAVRAPLQAFIPEVVLANDDLEIICVNGKTRTEKHPTSKTPSLVGHGMVMTLGKNGGLDAVVEELDESSNLGEDIHVNIADSNNETAKDDVLILKNKIVGPGNSG